MSFAQLTEGPILTGRAFGFCPIHITFSGVRVVEKKNNVAGEEG